MSQNARPQGRRGPSGAWSRLKPAVVDPLEVYGLPSKGETRLHDYKTQEAFYGKIVERYMKFCASSGGGHDLEAAFASLNVNETTPVLDQLKARPADKTTDKMLPSSSGSARGTDFERSGDLSLILMAMRKLREGILGSRRRDNFAQRAYIFIIHTSILTRSWESYQPALLYLLQHIHRYTPLDQNELDEFVAYHVLDLACRQYQLADACEVKLSYSLRNRRVHSIVRSLIRDDWVRFWRAQRAVDGYQRAIVEFAVERMRLHALKCVGRSYMNADKSFIERTGGTTYEELVKGGVGWQLEDNGNVIIRKPKPR